MNKIKFEIKKWSEKREIKKENKKIRIENELKLLLGEAVYKENKLYMISDKITKLMIGSEPAKVILTFFAFGVLTSIALFCGYVAFTLLFSIGINSKDISVLNVIASFIISFSLLLITVICSSFAIKLYERNAIRYGKYAVIVTKAIIFGISIYFLKETPLVEPLKIVLGL